MRLEATGPGPTLPAIEFFSNAFLLVALYDSRESDVARIPGGKIV
jgi:hypothetical protein